MTDFERDLVAFWRAHPDELIDELHHAMREKAFFEKRVALLWEARWPDKAMTPDQPEESLPNA